MLTRARPSNHPVGFLWLALSSAPPLCFQRQCQSTGLHFRRRFRQPNGGRSAGWMEFRCTTELMADML